MPEHHRHPWHRFYLHATTADPQDWEEDEISKALIAMWNADPPFFVTKRGARRALRCYEEMLPVRLYVRELA